jgi:hypothetical protein
MRSGAVATQQALFWQEGSVLPGLSASREGKPDDPPKEVAGYLVT